MKITTRNVLEGVVTAVKKGAVNDEIAIDLKGGLKVAAIVTSQSTETLGLVPGKEVLAMVKGVNVLLARDMDGYSFSSRNMLPGTVKGVKKGGDLRLRIHIAEKETTPFTGIPIPPQPHRGGSD